MTKLFHFDIKQTNAYHAQVEAESEEAAMQQMKEKYKQLLCPTNSTCSEQVPEDEFECVFSYPFTIDNVSEGNFV